MVHQIKVYLQKNKGVYGQNHSDFILYKVHNFLLVNNTVLELNYETCVGEASITTNHTNLVIS